MADNTARLSNEELNARECQELPLVMKSKPLLIYAEVTTQCNISCTMCGHTMRKRERSHMKREVYERLANYFYEGGRLALFGQGESILHPEFIYFLKLAKERGMIVSFNSNGQALDRTISKALVEYGQDAITLSCSAGTAKTYETIHRGAKWELLWSNIKTLLDERKTHYGDRLHYKPRIHIQFVLQMDNVKELPLLVKRAMEYRLDGVMVINLTATSPEMEKKQVNTKENSPIAEKYYGEALDIVSELKPKLNLPEFLFLTPNNYDTATKKVVTTQQECSSDNVADCIDEVGKEGSRARFCLEPWQTLFARHNGTVGPCVITGRSMGDLNCDTDIYNGPVYQTFRDRIRSGNSPYECMRCHLFPGPQTVDWSIREDLPEL